MKAKKIMETKIITDKNTWDNFFTGSYETSFFQSWNWGEFQEKMNKKVLRFGFFKEEQLVATAQGVVITAKRGKYLYVRNGPVSAWTDQNLTKDILESLKLEAKKLGLWFVRISPLIEKQDTKGEFLNKYPISPMFDVDALDTWILDITQSEDEILTNMRKNTRYDIRRAEKEGVEIIKTIDSKYIDTFYEIYLDTIERQQWTGYTKEFIKKQFETFVKDDEALLYLAKYQGKYVASSIFLYYGDSSYYHYSGSLTEFKKIPATSLIHWENIKEAKSRGLKKYNFWGIAPENKPNHPWQGLSFFKMGFGGYEKRWMETRDIPVSPLYYLTNLYERWDKLRKGY